MRLGRLENCRLPIANCQLKTRNPARPFNRQLAIGNWQSAVTLLEVILSMGLLVFLSSMTYWFYSSILGIRDSDTKTAQKLQLMRVVLQRMATEIRQASKITADGRVGIRGEAERIWLSTLHVPSKDLEGFRLATDEPPPGEYDLVKVEYKIARHPEIRSEEGYLEAIGLARVEHRIPRPDSAETGEAFEEAGQNNSAPEPNQEQELTVEEEELFGEQGGDASIGLQNDVNWEELYSKDIKFLRFCFFDGYRWWDDWDITGENPLPQLVQVTVGFVQHPPFDSEFGVRDPEAEEYCTCMNRDPVDCLPLAEDQFAMTVRISQADPFFRSRVSREVKSLTTELGLGEKDDAESDGASGGSQGVLPPTSGRTGTGSTGKGGTKGSTSGGASPQSGGGTVPRGRSTTGAGKKGDK